jgi:sugar lactone lactonase YvrE
MRAELVIDSADRLGECPLWDERSQALWWVDILAPAIKRFVGKLQVFPMPEPVGSIAFRTKGGLLGAMQSGIYVWESGNLRLLASPDELEKTHRFNDARCDRAGRFWVGTMKDREHTPTGAWSPDGRTMYFADSPRHKIWAFDYDADAGGMSNERLFAAPHPGFPDGSCVDAEGCLWNAEYGGARLDTLYITTAQGGGVYAVVPAVRLRGQVLLEGQGLPQVRQGPVSEFFRV